MSTDPDSSNDECGSPGNLPASQEEGVPVCAYCMTPHDPHAHRCEKCGANLGPIAGVYPNTQWMLVRAKPVDEERYSYALDWFSRVFFTIMGVFLLALSLLAVTRSPRYASDWLTAIVMLAASGTMFFLMTRGTATSKRLKLRAAGRCEHCGYLLKDLPENRCPECGTEFARKRPWRGN